MFDKICKYLAIGTFATLIISVMVLTVVGVVMAFVVEPYKASVTVAICVMIGMIVRGFNVWFNDYV